MKTMDEHLDEVWEQMMDEREESILLLFDDLDKILNDYITNGGDRGRGKITIYENWEHHINLLETGELPSYSNDPKKQYGTLKSQKDYQYLMEFLSYVWLEDDAPEPDVLRFEDYYEECYRENL